MNNWRKYKLGEIAEITSSKRIFLADYVSEGIPFYRSKEVIERFNKNKISTELFIEKSKFQEIKNKFGAPKEDDLLLTSVGTIGIPYLVQKKDEFYFKDGNLTWFKNYSNNILPKYLFYWIQSPIGKDALVKTIIGSTQQALTIVSLKQVEISLPDLPTQSRIARILTSFDDKIELLQQMNQTLETMAQAIFKEWFVDFNFPGFDGVLVDGLPKGWRRGKLGEVCEIQIGRTPPRIEEQWFSVNENDVKWISIKDMGQSGVYILNASEYLTNEAIEKFRIPIIENNTVILSFKLTVGRLAITTEKMLSNEAIAQLKSEINPMFLFLYFKNFNWGSLGSTSSIATAINSKTIKEIDILVPTENILNEFESLITPFFEKIKNNSLQIRTLTQLRDTLLPRLMSGAVSVAAGFSGDSSDLVADSAVVRPDDIVPRKPNNTLLPRLMSGAV